MAVRSPSDGDDSNDSNDSDTHPDAYANAGRDRADLPIPRDGRYETPAPADPATAAQAAAAAACDYPMCATCSWFATTAVVVHRTTGRACIPYCTRCSTDAIANGGHECGLAGLATLRCGDDADPPDVTFTTARRDGREEVLLTPAGQHTGPTTDPDPECTAWVKVSGEGAVRLSNYT